MTELKPCPFCGGKAWIDVYSDFEFIRCDHEIGCRVCPDTWEIKKFVPIKKQIEAWNRREGEK